MDCGKQDMACRSAADSEFRVVNARAGAAAICQRKRWANRLVHFSTHSSTALSFCILISPPFFLVFFLYPCLHLSPWPHQFGLKNPPRSSPTSATTQTMTWATTRTMTRTTCRRPTCLSPDMFPILRARSPVQVLSLSKRSFLNPLASPSIPSPA